MCIVFKYLVVQLLCVRVCVQVMQLVLLCVFVCLQKTSLRPLGILVSSFLIQNSSVAIREEGCARAKGMILTLKAPCVSKWRYSNILCVCFDLKALRWFVIRVLRDVVVCPTYWSPPVLTLEDIYNVHAVA